MNHQQGFQATTDTLRILVTGGNGLLANALRELAPPHMELTFRNSADFDITQRDPMAAQLARLHPDWVVNTAAYNLVDRCEKERELSWTVNAEGPKTLAAICVTFGCRLVHFGSDYVFDGAKAGPYLETDPTNPLNHYGAGKLAGERAVLAASPGNLVLRTSWLFGAHPTQAKSYVHSLLRLAREGKPLKSTTDQVSAPTYAADLAAWLVELIRQDAAGLFHAVNDEGLSRYEWTRAILSTAKALGLLSSELPVEPVLSAHFNPTMRRPNYSVLDNHKLTLQLGRPLGSWRSGLDAMLLQEAVTGKSNANPSGI